MKLRIFNLIWLNCSQIQGYLCDILHLEDRKTSWRVARFLKTNIGVAKQKSLRTPELRGSQLLTRYNDLLNNIHVMIFLSVIFWLYVELEKQWGKQSNMTCSNMNHITYTSEYHRGIFIEFFTMQYTILWKLNNSLGICLKFFPQGIFFSLEKQSKNYFTQRPKTFWSFEFLQKFVLSCSSFRLGPFK
jgi:hypothetical protein